MQSIGKGRYGELFQHVDGRWLQELSSTAGFGVVVDVVVVVVVVVKCFPKYGTNFLLGFPIAQSGIGGG